MRIHLPFFSLALVLMGGLGPLAAGAALAADMPLPHSVRLALQRAQVPESALAVWVQELPSGSQAGQVRLNHQAQVAVNPASLAKLTTTYAALDLLGPAWTWSTAVGVDGPLKEGVLQGSLYLRGSGDPKLVMERVWQGLRALRSAGLREIRGDIVLDRSAFNLPPPDPAAFDGDPSRPYNVQPDALLLNYHAHTLSFAAEAGDNQVRVSAEPFAKVDSSGLRPSNTPCKDWRADLQPRWQGGPWLVTGSYPTACGTQTWSLADPEPQQYGARLMASLWGEVGGSLGGQVREGRWSAQVRPLAEWKSPPLADVVRDINKFSNNVMAQQLFLTLPLASENADAPSTPERARTLLGRWVQQKLGPQASQGWVVDNGSGLSRTGRVTAQGLGALLQSAWRSPVMPELMNSLPVLGQDGTMRRARSGPPGRAHLKTGSLRDVAGVAGYVLGEDGQRRVLVAIINHANAQAARPALDALIQWSLGEDR